MSGRGVILKNMSQTHVRKVKADQIAALRAQVAELEGSETVAGEVLPVMASLNSCLPGGGFPRQQVTHMANCPALVVEIIAQASAAGKYIAVIGWPDLSLVQVGESGDLSKVVAIPDPGADAWALVGILAEGIDMIVCRGPEVTLSPARARPALAKIRGGQAAVLSVGTRIPGAGVQVAAEVVAYRGIGRGTGRIRGFDIAVQVRSKGTHGPARTVVTCGQPKALRSCA